MANVTPSVPPTVYYSPQSVQLVFGPDVEYANYTVNGIQPAISEYIAYDTLTPPNPFIAVTQDGRGNVVYDGGFPKFYNSVSPAAGTPFSGLTASFKYLYNALNFIANPDKVAAGNKKILVIGDRVGTTEYEVKSTNGYGFATSLTRICQIAGYTATIKDVSDYGQKINIALAELDQYCGVIFMASAYLPNNPELITPASIVDFVTYRSQGNGIIFITDHGTNVQTDITQVTGPAGAGFYATANRIMVNFGSYFTGNYDRTPVNVGFIRTTYGDHPLYNGMANNEDIFAGLSESKVIVAMYPKYTNANMPAVPMVDEGRYTVRVLAKLNDGTIEIYQFVYAIVRGAVVEIHDSGGNPITAVDTGFLDRTTIYPMIIGSTLGTIAGQVTVDDIKVGDLSFTELNGSVVTWLNGASLHVNDASVIKAEVTSPFNTYAIVNVTRFQPDLSITSSPASIQAKLRPFFGTIDKMGTIHNAITTISAPYSTAYAQNVAKLRDYTKR